ncbi:UDP-glucose 4-epimerase GalE [Streptomyces sp. WZ.A104]|uniref:UDP-glucose 4-epimerase GalE n=1 Tax=Streptomyces sp. WZ.A104 TaxID=2023771 RepID=UPI000BBCC71C|nr:UDP-glucose 4-epimerase GalE [Streptomyces sp. WZ.A104]PCG82815.1 UDP-glucose 4-epimerase GalE [Streptomyces sp. WZ.A104]
MRVAVTGGGGFLGSHLCEALLRRGDSVVCLDNFSTSDPTNIAHLVSDPSFVLQHTDVSVSVEVAGGVDAVAHLASPASPPDYPRQPLETLAVGSRGTENTLRLALRHDARFVLASTSEIYGDATTVPLTEESPAAPTNPYAGTKWTCEQVLADLCRRVPDLRVLALRYFNPAGAHPTGLLGEDPRGVPNNIMPFLAQVAVGRRAELKVFGDDYPTPDGTGVRDYIHVADVADGHRGALDHIDDEPGMRVFNLGTGRGASVLELVRTFEQVSGRAVPHRVAASRPGDVAELVADPAKAAAAWGWSARHDLAAMCRDAWTFQQQNAYGYAP